MNPSNVVAVLPSTKERLVMSRVPFLSSLLSILLSASTALADERRYDLSDFSKIFIQEGIGLDVKTGDFAVNAKAFRGNLDRLSIVKSGKSLLISRVINDPNDEFQVTVLMPKLEDLKVDTGSLVTSTVVLSLDFTLKVDTGSLVSIRSNDLTALSLTALVGSGVKFHGSVANITAKLDSGTEVKLSGRCQTLTADVLTGSILSAADMVCRSANVVASIGSSVEAHATEKVDLTAGDGSLIDISGNPKMRSVNADGGSSIGFD